MYKSFICCVYTELIKNILILDSDIGVSDG